MPADRLKQKVLLVALSAALIALTAVTFRSGGFSRTAGGTYTDPTFAWTIDVPDRMTLVPFDTQDRVTESGALISNTPIEHPDTLSELQDFPPEGVVLRIWHSEGGPFIPTSEDDSTFPLSVGDLRLVSRYVGGSEPKPLYDSFIANGADFSVAVWLGEEASDDARTAIAEALASVRFPPTEPGTALNDRLLVLDDASSYKVGSVTRYDRGELPLDDGRFSDYKGPFSFFLVHAPNGFYAITTDFLGNGEKCDLQVDVSSMTFSCPDSGWTWDRAGRALDRGEPWPDGTDELLVLPAPTSSAGHVMVDPFGNSPETAIAAWSG